MTIINKLNYEVYALDYLEGNLPAELVAEMEALMEKVPEIRAEMAELEVLPVVEADHSVIFEPKEQLKKKEARLIPLVNRQQWYRLTAVAASLLILWAGYWMGQRSVRQEQTPVVVAPLPAQKERPAKIYQKTEKPVVSIQPESQKLATTTAVIPKRNKTVVPKNKNVSVKNTTITNEVNKIAETATEQKITVDLPTKNIELQTSKAYVVNDSNDKKVRQRELIIVAPLASLGGTPLAIPTRGVESKEVRSFSEKFELDSKEIQLIAQRTERKSTLKNLIGRLPGEGVQVSFVPTFFQEQDSE